MTQKIGKALQTYEILAQDNFESVPRGSMLFGCPDELIIKSKDPAPRSLLDRLMKRSPQTTLQFAVGNWTQYTLSKLQDNVTGGDYILNESLQYRELDKDGRETRAEKNVFSERLWMAMFGGLALLVPVIIMTLVEGVTASLVTTSVSIGLFAFVLAIQATNTLGKDILAATATHAAVLVVFVGTSTTQTTTQKTG